jgi:hypothetical protein
MAIPHLLVAVDRGLSKRSLAMGVCSASDIPAFRQHATVLCNDNSVAHTGLLALSG